MGMSSTFDSFPEAMPAFQTATPPRPPQAKAFSAPNVQHIEVIPAHAMRSTSFTMLELHGTNTLMKSLLQIKSVEVEPREMHRIHCSQESVECSQCAFETAVDVHSRLQPRCIRGCNLRLQSRLSTAVNHPRRSQIAVKLQTLTAVNERRSQSLTVRLPLTAVNGPSRHRLQSSCKNIDCSQ